jgi:hypothetical protein
MFRLTPALLLVTLLPACMDKSGDTGGGANLLVTGLGCSTDSGQLVCEVLVENNGGGDAGAFQVGLYLDQADEPLAGEVATASTGVSGLAAGEVQTVVVPASPCGSCSIWALVDARDDIGESDETDNASGPTTVGG